MKIPNFKIYIIFVFTLVANYCIGQQNITMYTLPVNPQVNTLNPAFQNECKLFIGIPLLSSVHFNYGNDAFTYHQLFKKDGTGYLISPSNISPGKTRSISTEGYVALFNIGFWRKKNYITFSVHEKMDFAGFFNHDFFAVATGGNTSYEEKKADFSNCGLLMDYRREYALGIARKINETTTLGIKGKLLFGKINLKTSTKNTYINTDPNTFDINTTANVRNDISAPINVALDPYGKPNSFDYTGNTSQILFNRKNIGLAFDLGFIKKWSETETISGSILDLGMIRYASTPSNYNLNGSYNFTGQFGDSSITSNFLRSIVDTILNNYNSELTNNEYYYFMPPRLYLSYALQYSPKTTLHVTGTAKIYRQKINPGISVAASHQLRKNISVAVSWSFLYRSFKNIGAGVVIGKSPVQFYMFSDNVWGLIDPLNTRNLNLRFGINLNFGCTKKVNYKSCGCEGMENSVEKDKKLRKLTRK